MHRIPNKGVGFNILAYVDGDTPLNFEKRKAPEIVFNYLGDVSGNAEQGKYFAPYSREGFSAGLDYQSPKNCDGPDLAVNCLIDGGLFSLWLNYNADIFSDDVASSFADGILQEIQQIAGYLDGQKGNVVTASDLGETSWSDEEFDAVVAEFASHGEHIQRIYPLTPLQEGILLSHVMNPYAPAYRLVDIYELDFLPTEQQLRKALDALSLKHEVLRTAIIHKNVSVPRQAITDRKLSLTITDISGEADKMSVVNSIRAGLLKDGFDLQDKPLFSVVCAKTSDNSCYIITAVHHIIIDGWCMNTCLKDFEDFLKGAGTPQHFTRE